MAGLLAGAEAAATHQPAQGPHFGSEEVRSNDAAPMGLQKHRPGSTSSPLWCRLNALTLQHVGDGAASDLVPQIVESPLNTGVAQRGFSSAIRTMSDDLGDDPHRAQAPRLAAAAEVKLPSNQLPVPAQQRVSGVTMVPSSSRTLRGMPKALRTTNALSLSEKRSERSLRRSRSMP